MNGINHFLKKLSEETAIAGQEEVSKNLAKEDVLAMIANFVKDVKKKFLKSADRLEILNAANKTLDFYINNIESEDISFELPEPINSMDSSENEGDEDMEPVEDSGFEEGEF